MQRGRGFQTLERLRSQLRCRTNLLEKGHGRLISVCMHQFDIIDQKLLLIRDINQTRRFAIKQDDYPFPKNLEDYKQYKTIMNSDINFLRVIPVPKDRDSLILKLYLILNSSKFKFSRWKDQEFPLIAYGYDNSSDNFTRGFVTGRIPHVKLHYFEHANNFEGTASEYGTYNIFTMDQDFWSIIFCTQGVHLSTNVTLSMQTKS